MVKKYWKDYMPKWNYYLIPLTFGACIGLTYGLLIGLFSGFEQVLVIGAVVATFVVIYNIFNTKMNYIDEQGIYVGNAKGDHYSWMPTLNRGKYLSWAKISTIKIFGEDHRRPSSNVIWNFLQVESQNGGTYKSFVNDVDGCLAAMKELNKNRLLHPNSKRLENERKTNS